MVERPEVKSDVVSMIGFDHPTLSIVD